MITHLKCEPKYEQTHQNHESEEIFHKVTDDDCPGSEHVMEGQEVEELNEAAQHHTPQHLVSDVDHVILAL